MLDVVRSPWIVSPLWIVAKECAILSISWLKTKNEARLDKLTWMVEIANAVKEVFDSEGLIAKVLHEDLALG